MLRATNDSSFYPPDNSFQHSHSRPTRSQIALSGSTQQPTSRPLSSADETGPVPKKLRSTTRQPDAIKPSKPNKLTVDEPLRKARARPALTFANFFSSSGRHSQPTTSSSRTAIGGLGKSGTQQIQPSNPSIATRRSTRLLTGTGSKQPHPSKVRAARSYSLEFRLTCLLLLYSIHNCENVADSLAMYALVP
jgi:anaphase-promoting complex subunit 3